MNYDLSLIKKHYDIKIYENGEFDGLGFVSYPHKAKKLLIFLEDEAYLDEVLNHLHIACVICTPSILPKIKDKNRLGIGISQTPKILFYKIHNYLLEHTQFYGKNFKSQISSTAFIDPSAYIAKNNVKIEEGVRVGPHVSILENVVLKKNSIIGPGCVIGGEGFQFAKTKEYVLSIKHAGRVIIGEEVEIKANCCVDKGIFRDDTEIGAQCKLDNLVYVAHGVRLGSRGLVGAHVSITGYTQIGQDVWIGPSSCIRNMICIGDHADIKMGSVVTQNVKAYESISGNFAVDHNEHINVVKSMIKKGC